MNIILYNFSTSYMILSGTMKTYWLEKREERSYSTKGIAIQQPPQWHSNSITKRMSISVASSAARTERRSTENSASGKTSRVSSPAPPSSASGHQSEDRRTYSPITFQDVARRSVANSPIKSADIKGITSVITQ